MDQNEEEQVEALRRWWDENGKSTVAAVVIALASWFGWTAYKDHQVSQGDLASDLYQSMQKIVAPARGGAIPQQGIDLGEQLKRDHSGSTYAQFAALHLAAVAVESDDLANAEAQLRWVLGRADKGSDTERVAQLRLARVLAASGDLDQALAIIEGAESGSYGGSYAAAKGDILLALGRSDEAREAYSQALALSGVAGSGGLSVVEQKLESLMPAKTTSLDSVEDEAAEAVIADPVDESPMAESAIAAEPVAETPVAENPTAETLED